MKRNRHQFLLSQYHHNHAVQLVHGGKTYFDKLIAMIDGASNCIHLQTYIYENDATGQQVTQALIAAAGRGVAIYVLLDSYGSEGWKQSWPAALEEAGVHFRWFSSVANNQHFYLGRRLHHKVVVADAQRCLVGGVNISNRYNDLPNDPAWLDWALYCEGPAAAILDVVCLRIWQRDVSRKKD
ncbi:phospholipase D-like domain-containing protein [Phnomibacter ginsenosidimutans]|nr:phospholipase D-like domain-containing protein [Phnomibacter ginsenosidimutans]